MDDPFDRYSLAHWLASEGRPREEVGPTSRHIELGHGHLDVDDVLAARPVTAVDPM